MKLSMRLSSLAFGVAFLALPLTASAQTPDGSTPSEEAVCDGLSGALFGLCNAYCEALDCDTGLSNPTACAKVLANYQQRSGGANPPCMVVLDTCEDKATELFDLAHKTCMSSPDQKDCDVKAKLAYETHLQACKSQCSKATDPRVCEDSWRPCTTVCQDRADSSYSECAKTGKAEECAQKASEMYYKCSYEELFGENVCVDWCKKGCGDDYACASACGGQWQCDPKVMSCP